MIFLRRIRIYKRFTEYLKPSGTTNKITFKTDALKSSFFDGKIENETINGGSLAEKQSF
jgi:hypothetical protein